MFDAVVVVFTVSWLSYNLFFSFQITITFIANQSPHFFKRVIKMFAAVVVVFTVSWLPYHLFFLVSYHFPQV